MNLLRPDVQDNLRALPDSQRLSPLPRCTTLFSQSQPADALFLIEDGLVKLTRASNEEGRIILTINGPGQLVGEEAMSEEAQSYYAEAASITAATVYRIPRSPILTSLRSSDKLGAALVSYLLNRKLNLAEKVELLCLHDVEYRILHYLAQLSNLLPAVANGTGHQLPITQLELADLIGATRETTSTTLNQLERRGLLKLSRRLLTVPSPEELVRAATARAASTNGKTKQQDALVG